MDSFIDWISFIDSFIGFILSNLSRLNIYIIIRICIKNYGFYIAGTGRWHGIKNIYAVRDGIRFPDELH